MQIQDKQVVLFPEFHLSDFPPQISFTQHEAELILRDMNKNKAGIIISGYVEKSEDNLYSSCLILDGEKVYNIRKKHPYRDESEYIKSWKSDFICFPLSIGKSYFFICNDITVELEKEEFAEFVKDNLIENLFLISAMEMNFEKYIDKLKYRSVELGIRNVIYCDRFNGIGQINL